MLTIELSRRTDSRKKPYAKDVNMVYSFAQWSFCSLRRNAVFSMKNPKVVCNSIHSLTSRLNFGPIQPASLERDASPSEIQIWSFHHLVRTTSTSTTIRHHLPPTATMPNCAANLEQLFQSLDIATVSDIFTLEDLASALNISEPSSLPNPVSPHVKRHIGPKCHHHELHFQYPSYELLVPNAVPHLAPPKSMAHREQPHLAYYHIHDSDDTDLCCSVRLNAQQTRAASFLPPSAQQTNLIAMINRLSETPGISTRHLLCMKYQGVLAYKVRLSKTWMTATGQSTETQDYGCLAGELTGFLTALSGVPWADALDDLINRASDFSYLFVRDQMMRYSYADAQAEWSTFQWNNEPISPVNHVLADCFEKCIVREDVDNNQQLEVRMLSRRGHVVRISREQLYHIMPRNECVAFCCPTCVLRAMDKSSLYKVSIADDVPRRREFLAKDHVWHKIYSSLDPYVVFQVRNVELRKALEDALKLLTPPDSIMHST